MKENNLEENKSDELSEKVEENAQPIQDEIQTEGTVEVVAPKVLEAEESEESHAGVVSGKEETSNSEEHTELEKASDSEEAQGNEKISEISNTDETKEDTKMEADTNKPSEIEKRPSASDSENPENDSDSSNSKATTKYKKIIGGVIGVVLAASCVIGGISYNNYQQSLPDARLKQAIEYVKEGDFDDAASYASKSGYWSMADLLGSDATDAQRAKIADLMYGDLDFTVKKVSVNKDETSAVVTVKVKNYNVYSAALGVQITSDEMAGKTAAQSRALLVKKANKQIKTYKKKNKKITNTVHFNMIKKNDKWVVDTSDTENKMSMLSLLGIQVDTYDASSSSSSDKKTTKNSKKKSSKKTSSSTGTSTGSSMNSGSVSTSAGSSSKTSTEASKTTESTSASDSKSATETKKETITRKKNAADKADKASVKKKAKKVVQK